MSASPQPALRAGTSYALFLLTFAYTLAYVDRQVLNLLVDPIKQSLLLGDTQVSLLQGLSFMAAYVAFGPLFGRWVDNGNRRNILVFGVIAWSVSSALCGFADSFWSLFLARAGVGAAEACLSPVAWSLIADYFDRERLPRAMSLFMIAPSLGGGLALLAGGAIISFSAGLGSAIPFLSGLEPWQLVFVLTGVPGILLGLVLLVSLKEPPRTNSVRKASAQHYTLRETSSFFIARRAFYVRFYLGISSLAIITYALAAWIPALLMRNHGVSPGTVGLMYGAPVLVFGSAAVLLGPWVGRQLTNRGYSDAPLRLEVIVGTVVAMLCAGIAFASIPAVIVGLAVGAMFFHNLPLALAAAALQIVTPNRMRGVAASIYVFVASVLGIGLAPTLVALLTDFVFRDPHQVHLALAIVCASSAAFGTWMLWGALPHYRGMLREVEAESAQA
ncbi:MFS transporter [Steroidobacter sp.]|uniref:MFS transporter n=1 Tax=Steroidobacter sp. TaxID=1978227 RepID=UPI001A4F400B|nr:MFS transporter [Steroidobacter sp.]MBL8269933.1 MFS transporter [Steroidobacter sp.]